MERFRNKLPLIALLVITNLMGISAFTPEKSWSTRTDSSLSFSNESRRQFFSQALTFTSGLVISPFVSNADIEGVASPSFPDPKPQLSDEGGVTLYSSKSGLKYIILKEGTGPSPKYGQFVKIAYTSYIKLPDVDGVRSKLEKYDEDSQYLIKHGSGRMIPGLDEGLHTMKVGEKRRIIIPPKLGYIGPGVLGPLPDSPWGRYKLNRLLEDMIEAKGGNVVMDVELKNVITDEADQGYYEDESLSPDDFNKLRFNLQEKARVARTVGSNSPLLTDAQ
jgi:hypothetical protein